MSQSGLVCLEALPLGLRLVIAPTRKPFSRLHDIAFVQQVSFEEDKTIAGSCLLLTSVPEPDFQATVGNMASATA